MHAPKTHAHPATKNSTGSIRIAISFARMFRFQYKPAFSTAKLAQNAADLAQTIDLVEGILRSAGNGDRRLTTTMAALGHSLSIALAKFG